MTPHKHDEYNMTETWQKHDRNMTKQMTEKWQVGFRNDKQMTRQMTEKWQNNDRTMTEQWQVGFRNYNKNDKAKWKKTYKIIIPGFLACGCPSSS